MEENITVFSGEYINSKLECIELQESIHNHLVFDHSYTDYFNLSITILNLILVIYLIYKLNTNKDG